MNNRILGTASAYCGIDIAKMKESFRGSNCASYHWTLADGSDYYYAAASADLAAITSGADASRYRRGAFVPLIFTRYGLSALINADKFILSTIIHSQESETERSEMKMTPDAEPLKLSRASTTQIGSTPSSHLKVHFCQENRENVVQEVGAINLTIIPEEILTDVCLRASLCSALLFYGLPLNSNKEPFRIVEECYFGDAHAKRNKGMKGFFSMSSFISAASKILGSQILLIEEVIK